MSGLMPVSQLLHGVHLCGRLISNPLLEGAIDQQQEEEEAADENMCPGKTPEAG